MFRVRLLVLCAFLAALLTGCSSASGVATNAESSVAYAAAAPGPMRNAGNAYLLGPGDRLRVKVYSDPDMSGEYEINSGGSVSLPLVGDVKASGLTTRQLEQTLAARMKGKVANEPHVSVEIASYAPFYIYGEVKKAGEYPYRPGLTVADAVATAGGLTYRANERKISVRRAGSSAEYFVPIGAPVKVYPGDTIRVAESFF